MASMDPDRAPAPCPECGTEVAPALLACPSCGRLVHAAELKRLADEAEQAARTQDLVGALAAWQKAQNLLPPGSRQHEIISGRMEAIQRQLDVGQYSGSGPALSQNGTNPSESRSGWLKGAAGLGTLGLLLWKFKIIVLFVATKAKFLLLGLTKASTFLSMLLSLGVYWAAWGWSFALGLVLSIYIHEMGHVAALRRFGIRATAPMFIPGVGALVRLKQAVKDPVQDARIGLAGPIWGLGAALAAYAVYLVAGWPILAAIARVGAWINLFNLMPIWQLDGGRGFRSLTHSQRWLAVAALAVQWFLTGEALLLLLLVLAVVQACSKSAASRPDWTGLLQYVVLATALAALSTVPVPQGG